MTINNEFTYDLTTPVRYAKDGDEAEGYILTLKAPTMAHSRFSYKLEQMIMRAMLDAEKAIGDRNGVDIAGTEVTPVTDKSAEARAKEAEDLAGMIEMAIMVSEKVDLDEFVSSFGKLATFKGAPVCIIEDEQPMTDVLWSKMSPMEARKLAVKYAANFCATFVADMN